ncbi:MAG: ABC transporter substrate-binding protein [Oxalobacter sp.]|nr:ABC transporter substrate-binding protein [Oxalobacter sp.]
MKKLLTALLLGITALFLVACGSSQPTKKIRVAYSPALCEAYIHIAIEKGFLQAEGLEVEKIQVDGAHIQEAIGAGQIDGGGGLVSKFLLPVENGLPIKFVAGMHSGCIKVLVANGSPLNKVADLKGKKIGVPGLADASTLMLKRSLAAAGISVDEKNPEVEFVVYNKNDLVQALSNGSVDAIGLLDPIASIAAEKAHLKTIFDNGETKPYNKEICCAIFVASQYAKDNPEGAAAFTRAVMKAAAWIHEHPEEAAKIQLEKKYVAGDVTLNARLLKGFNYHPTVQGGYEAVKANAKELASIGILKKTPDTQKFADSIFLFQKGVPETYSAAEVANVK